MSLFLGVCARALPDLAPELRDLVRELPACPENSRTWSGAPASSPGTPGLGPGAPGQCPRVHGLGQRSPGILELPDPPGNFQTRSASSWTRHGLHSSYQVAQSFKPFPSQRQGSITRRRLKGCAQKQLLPDTKHRIKAILGARGRHLFVRSAGGPGNREKPVHIQVYVFHIFLDLLWYVGKPVCLGRCTC